MLFRSPNAENTFYKHLIHPTHGPAAVVVRAPAHAALAMPPAAHGRFEVILEGTAFADGQELGPPGVRYYRGAEAATPLVTGADGGTIAFLTFDKDALNGGISGDALAVEAAEAMARAI